MRSITELLGMRDEQEVKEFNELRDANDLIDAENFTRGGSDDGVVPAGGAGNGRTLHPTRCGAVSGVL